MGIRVLDVRIRALLGEMGIFLRDMMPPPG